MGSRQAQLAIGGGLVAFTTAYFLLRYVLPIFENSQVKTSSRKQTDGRRGNAFEVPENVAFCRHLRAEKILASTYKILFANCIDIGVRSYEKYSRIT
jgi:hypothetical protein